MKQLVLKLDVNDEQDVNIALDRIARISGKYEITMDKTSKLCTVKGDDIDPIQIVRKLRMLCHVEIVAVERPKEPEKKKEEMVEVVNASSLAAAIGPSKEPKKKEDQPEKEEPTKQEEEKKGEEIITVRAGGMKKAVFKLDLDDEKSKTKAMRRVCGVPGVDSVSMDMKDMKMTVIGYIEPVQIVSRLRKICCTKIIAVGPAKEPEKKKEELGEHCEDPVAELVKAYNPDLTTHYHVRSVEDDPNACFIS